MEDFEKNDTHFRFGRVSCWELQSRDGNEVFVREGENGIIVCLIEIRKDGVLKYSVRHPDKDKMVPYDGKKRTRGESDDDFILRVMRECDEIVDNEYRISPAYETFAARLRKFRQKWTIIDRVRSGHIRPEIGRVLLDILDRDEVETYMNYSAYFDPHGVYIGIFPSGEGINAGSLSPLRSLMKRCGLI